MRWSVMWLAFLTLLASCASGGAGIDACGAWRPILVSRADTLTNGTARQILAHNETGARLCSW
jgi:hypothetical protein